MDFQSKTLHHIAADMQMQLRHFKSCWALNGEDSVSMQMCILNSLPYSEAMMGYNSFIESRCSQEDYFASTSLSRPDSVDKIDICNETTMEAGSVTGPISEAFTNNTSEVDINKENERFNSFLGSRSQDFIRSLIWTEFEDGVENEITRLVVEYVKRNKYVTYCWLYKLFNENRSNPVITSGLLRTLGMVVDIQDAGYLMTMVTAGLSSLHAEDQEAAIMVVEKWRTKECLDAMVNTSYGSPWIKEYASQVVHELKEELEV